MKKDARDAIAREAAYGFIDHGPQWVESARGFETFFKGRFELAYREGDHVLQVPIDWAGGGVVIIQFSEVRGWQPPHDSEPLPDAKRAEIRENLAASMRRMRTGFTFE